MWIRLKSAVGEHKPGDFLDCDEAVARGYCAAGLAEESPEGPEKELLRQAREEYLATLREFAKDTATSLKEAATGLRRPRIDAGEQQADRTRGFGDFLRNVIAAEGSREPERAAAASERLTKVYGVSRGLNEATGTAGGFTTPVQYETQVLELAAEEAVYSSGATVVPMGARTVEWPSLDQFQAPAAGSTAFYGGVQVYRKAEAAQRTATQPRFTKVELTATDLTAYTEISRDLLQDSTATLDAMVPRLIGGAIGWKEDWECLQGTGQGQFLGVLNAPSSLLLARNTGGTIKYVDLLGMFQRLYSQSKKMAVWLCHPYTVGTLLQIQDPSGRYILLPYFSPDAGAVAAGPVYRLFGMPLLETEKAPTVGNTGDLILSDRSRYLLGRRAGLELGLSEHFKFDTDQVAIRAKLRNDGQPQLKKPITLADGSDQVSTTVVLQ